MIKKNDLVGIDLSIIQFDHIFGPLEVTYTNKEYFNIETSNIRWSQKSKKPLITGRVYDNFYYEKINKQIICTNYPYSKYNFVPKLIKWDDFVAKKVKIYRKYMNVSKDIHNIDFGMNFLLEDLNSKNVNIRIDIINKILIKVDEIKKILEG